MTAAKQPLTDWSCAPIILKPRDVAQLLDCSLPNTYALFHRVDFPAIRLSEKNLRVEKNALRSWLDEQAQKGA